LLGLFAFANIAKHNHRAGDGTILADRNTGVFYGKSGAVFAPQDLVVPVADRAPGQAVVHRALLYRIGAAIGPGMVDQGMDLLSDQLIGLEAQHGQSGWIDEVHQSILAHAKNTFFYEFKQQSAAFLGLLEARLILFQFGRSFFNTKLQLII